ncbi:MAG: folylpolyglutamate synthase/dihydrofolate synthase family protein [Chloroflexota bacterium]
MDYQTAIHYIESFTDYEKAPGIAYTAANYDLRRMEQLLERLGNPHLGAHTVHVAGTKGKGSTAALISSALVASGLKTALFTSPHLHTMRERIVVDGEMITPEDFAALMTSLQPEVEAVHRQSSFGGLTTFEILTALAFAYFARRRVQFLVVEAGLGGRLDATNVVKPEVCVITSISLDHTEVLGHSLAKIATEKAGIIKAAAAVVCSPQRDEVLEVIGRICVEKGTRLISVGKDVRWRCLDVTEMGQSFEVEGNLDRCVLRIPLLGEYQLENAAAAVAALEELIARGAAVSRQGIALGFERVRWPGRLEVVGRSPAIVVDGAHNRYSAMKLMEAISQYFTFHRLILVLGTSSDKDISGIVDELVPFADEVIITRSRHPRSASIAAILSEFNSRTKEVRVADDVPSAMAAALSAAKPTDLILATGSLFLVAEAIECLRGVKPEAFTGPERMLAVSARETTAIDTKGKHATKRCLRGT